MSSHLFLELKIETAQWKPEKKWEGLTSNVSSEVDSTSFVTGFANLAHIFETIFVVELIVIVFSHFLLLYPKQISYLIVNCTTTLISIEPKVRFFEFRTNNSIAFATDCRLLFQYVLKYTRYYEVFAFELQVPISCTFCWRSLTKLSMGHMKSANNCKFTAPFIASVGAHD